MVYNVLLKYLNIYDPIPKRGSGLKAPQLKQLNELKIIKFAKLPNKTGKMPTSPNAFELTLFGRSVIREATDNTIAATEILHSLKILIEEIKTDHDLLKESINQVNSKIIKVEDILNSIDTNPSKTRSKSKPTSSELITILKNAEKHAGKQQKLGPHTSVEEYYIALRTYDYTNNEINNILHDLFQKGKIDLQQGPQRGNSFVLSPSGKKFQWGKIKG